MHLRLAISQGGDGDGRHQGGVDNARHPDPDPALEGPHVGLVEARRHYFRYIPIYAYNTQFNHSPSCLRAYYRGSNVKSVVLPSSSKLRCTF